jgi:hypothetical protein
MQARASSHHAADVECNAHEQWPTCCVLSVLGCLGKCWCKVASWSSLMLSTAPLLASAHRTATCPIAADAVQMATVVLRQLDDSGKADNLNGGYLAPGCYDR